jgi:hypothetical protein
MFKVVSVPVSFFTTLLVLAVFCERSQAQTDSWPIPGLPQAPPPAVHEWAPSQPVSPPFKPLGGTLQYSVGQPTDEEQLYLEFLNRARANPPAEGARLAATTEPDVLSAYNYFGVDLLLLQSQFQAIPATPPLAMNAQLLAAARLHSGDMFTNQYQDHGGTDGSDPGTRITAQGYSWYTYGENIYSYADSVFFGHAGFEVDWGFGTGGMQTPPGHRENIHYPAFREAGIGVVNGVNGSVGPQLVTQDLATRQSATPFITGVVYYDFNGNNFYDLGEGIGGVSVDVNNSSYFAVTANSGGYAVPIGANGTYIVTFSANGMSPIQRTVTVTNLANLKLDYTPVYSAPVVSGPNPALLNQTNTYNFTAVAAAIQYQVERSELRPYSTVEGAENGSNNVSVIASAGYSVLIKDLVASGNSAFHLAQPSAVAQTLALNPTFRANTNSQLMFAKRFGWGTANQVAHAQISTNTGASWVDLWNQPGNSSSGDTSFSRISASLAPYAGQLFQVRFVYDFRGGSYFSQTDSTVGLCLDDIAVSNVEQVVNAVTNTILATNTFTFSPNSTNDSVIRVRAVLPGRTFAWGPAMRVKVALPPPALQVVRGPVRVGTQLQLEWTVTDYRPGMTFQLWKAADPGAAWFLDGSASFQTLVAGSRFQATIPADNSAKMFYRIRGSY